MTIRKAILAVCMLGFLVFSVSSMFGVEWFLPGVILGEITGNQTERLAVIRAATFLTMAFFIFRHLRNKRPLSAVAPVQVFVNCLIVIGIFRVPFANENWFDWVTLGALCLASVLLHFENRSDAQRIFKSDW